MNIQSDMLKETLTLGREKLKNLPGVIKSFPKTFKEMSRKKKVLVIVAIALVLLLLIRAIFSGGSAAKAFTTVKADRGDISVIISGTGTIKPIDEYEVTSLVKGEILMDTFQEGDMVEKGDLLYQIDSSDLENTLEKAQLNLQKSQLSYNQTMEELDKLNVKSKYSGTITETYVKVGDSVNNGTRIADLIDKNTMILSLPFLENEASTISVGSLAEIMLTNSFYRLQGTVRRVSSGSLVSAEGVRVKTVEIAVDNPGTVSKGDTATAIVGDVACNSPGTFDYNLETTITAETAGEVVAMDYGKGDLVSAGSVVVRLSSSNSNSTRLSSQISLRDSQLSIENYNKQLEEYQITAPISGTVLKKTSKAGDTLDTGNSQVVMAVIADMSTIVFEMNVDELDISKISVGQRVSVTADALGDRVYSAYVDYVSVVGTTQNGVTTYPITVVVEEPEDLIPGMNVSAEILVESRKDVLRVPVTAVNRGNIVYVKGHNPDADAGQDATGAPEGFYPVRVETGLNDSAFIEILSGLSEGEEVYVTVQGTGSNPMAAMMGMAGANVPAGGMGGMPAGGDGSGRSGMSGGR